MHSEHQMKLIHSSKMKRHWKFLVAVNALFCLSALAQPAFTLQPNNQPGLGRYDQARSRGSGFTGILSMVLFEYANRIRDQCHSNSYERDLRE